MIAQIHGAMVEASAVNGHQQQVARRQRFGLLQLAEARGLPAVIKIWRRLELIWIGAAFPVAQHDATLGIPVASKRPAVMHRPHPLAAY